jgi:hypothetical protein
MIAAYFRERFRVGLFAPLAAGIAVAASGGTFDALRFIANASFALLLVAEFRLLDDLVDRRHDAETHPGRVLVRSTTNSPFIWTYALLAAANLAISTAAAATVSLPVLLALHAALAVWYLTRSRRTIAGDQLLLAKYPAFVVIVAGPRVATAPLPIAAGALVVYAAVSLYEAWHDPASPLAALLGGRS